MYYTHHASTPSTQLLQSCYRYQYQYHNDAPVIYLLYPPLFPIFLSQPHVCLHYISSDTSLCKSPPTKTNIYCYQTTSYIPSHNHASTISLFTTLSYHAYCFVNKSQNIRFAPFRLLILYRSVLPLCLTLFLSSRVSFFYSAFYYIETVVLWSFFFFFFFFFSFSQLSMSPAPVHASFCLIKCMLCLICRLQYLYTSCICMYTV